jgi:hypothetical protein
MNIYKDTMPPVFVALRLTAIAFAGIIIIIVLNLLLIDFMNANKFKMEKTINKKLIPSALEFNRKKITNFSDNKTNYYYEAVDNSGNIIGYTIFVDCNDYGDNLKIAIGINNDMTLRSLKLLDNYKILHNITDLSDFDNYMERIYGENISNINSLKNSFVFHINKGSDYKNQIAFNSILNCIEEIYQILKEKK